MNPVYQHIINFGNEVFRRNLAEKLGITFDELTQLNFSIDISESEEGPVYYIITFDTDSPEEIMNKIGGTDENNQLRLGQWEIDDDD